MPATHQDIRWQSAWDMKMSNLIQKSLNCMLPAGGTLAEILVVVWPFLGQKQPEWHARCRWHFKADFAAQMAFLGTF